MVGGRRGGWVSFFPGFEASIYDLEGGGGAGDEFVFGGGYMAMDVIRLG